MEKCLQKREVIFSDDVLAIFDVVLANALPCIMIMVVSVIIIVLWSSGNRSRQTDESLHKSNRETSAGKLPQSNFLWGIGLEYVDCKS